MRKIDLVFFIEYLDIFGNVGIVLSPRLRWWRFDDSLAWYNQSYAEEMLTPDKKCTRDRQGYFHVFLFCAFVVKFVCAADRISLRNVCVIGNVSVESA